MFKKLFLSFIIILAPLSVFAQCPAGNGSITQYPNDTSTGTTANEIVALTSSGNAIKFPHTQTAGSVGVSLQGSGVLGPVCVQSTGEVYIIADGNVTNQHWVIPSTTTDGYIHDTGVACTTSPAAPENVIGCARSANAGGSGVAVDVALNIYQFSSGISGTASSNCTIKGSGSNTVSCGAGTDTGTYLQPGEILDMQSNAASEESTTAAGTYTVGNLACITASNTVGDCPSAAANSRAIGVNLAKNGSLPVTAKWGSGITVNSSASVVFTAGDYVCSDASNAAKFIDNGTTPCISPQLFVGFTKVTDGGSQTTHTIDLQMGIIATQTIASGTATMGTSGISSGTCATAVTSTATGGLSTDSIIFTPNTDPTAVTGYAPSASGSLYIWAWVSSNTANFRVCNPSSGTITPSALTLNWRVTR